MTGLWMGKLTIEQNDNPNVSFDLAVGVESDLFTQEDAQLLFSALADAIQPKDLLKTLANIQGERAAKALEQAQEEMDAVEAALANPTATPANRWWWLRALRDPKHWPEL